MVVAVKMDISQMSRIQGFKPVYIGRVRKRKFSALMVWISITEIENKEGAYYGKGR